MINVFFTAFNSSKSAHLYTFQSFDEEKEFQNYLSGCAMNWHNKKIFIISERSYPAAVPHGTS